MTHRDLFIRKVIYLAILVALLLPLSWLSQPATTKSEGGKLARLRTEHDLSQADLGDIDPTGATIKLATMGMHGIAANLLWTRANRAKDKEDWVTFVAALEQITKLQPNFVAGWRFHAHQLSYNISVEFDDYHDRYTYVREGIELLKKGIRYNEADPRLPNDLGFFIGFKIGLADESEQFRRLFREDDDFHNEDLMVNTDYAGRPPSFRDNWEVSRWWREELVNLVDTQKVSYTRLNPILMYSEPAKAQMQFAVASEKDGEFGEIAKSKWRKAAEMWDDYGQRQFSSVLGFSVSMEDSVKYTKLRNDYIIDLVKLEPELAGVLMEARDRRRVPPQELIEKMKPEDQERGKELLRQLADATARLKLSIKNREVVNYSYWKKRCEIELTPEILEAREAIFEGRRAYEDTDLPFALERFEYGIDRWREVIDLYPNIVGEPTMLDELMRVITYYAEILTLNGQERPRPFTLQMVVDEYNRIQENEQAAEQASQAEAR